MTRPPEKVLIRPVITEKTSALQYDGTDAVDEEEAGDTPVKSKYTFEVASDATKPEIRRAVEALFEVRVTDVRTMNVRGKSRRVNRFVGRRPHWKKAIVTVGEDEMIDLFESV